MMCVRRAALLPALASLRLWTAPWKGAQRAVNVMQASCSTVRHVSKKLNVDAMTKEKHTRYYSALHITFTSSMVVHHRATFFKCLELSLSDSLFKKVFFKLKTNDLNLITEIKKNVYCILSFCNVHTFTTTYHIYVFLVYKNLTWCNNLIYFQIIWQNSQPYTANFMTEWAYHTYFFILYK